MLKIATLDVSAICNLYLPLSSTAGSVAAYDHAFKYENGSGKHLSAILRYLLKVLAFFYGSYFLNNRKKFLLNILLKETPSLIKKRCIMKNTTSIFQGDDIELSSWVYLNTLQFEKKGIKTMGKIQDVIKI